jgi:glycerol-3-phosphate acyltransferase PlsY
MLILCCILSIGFLTVDLARFKFYKIRQLFLRIFGFLLKEEEQNKKITGATHLFISATIVIFLFNKTSVVPALFLLSIADAGAAIYGTIFGKYRLFEKTWEGSIAFFLLSALIIFISLEIKLETVFMISIIITIIEVLPIPVNDNYTVAIGSAFIFSLIL